ncbi:thrombospondin type 3 repeat-containing protein [Chitinophaga sp. 22620]|uniref:thrombospondin type 3 repeat-containing protein n=1 Tax=Chitinophaga sp. 22620 TaxID=3453952 RepID=UPI003F86C013
MKTILTILAVIISASLLAVQQMPAQASTQPKQEVTAQHAAGDRDNDGVEDSVDRCPDTPAGVQVDAWGCPVTEGGGEGDQDIDGVPDEVDLCPNTPLGTPVDANGCPV